MGINPLNLISLKEALPSLDLRNGDVPDPKKLAEAFEPGTYKTLTIPESYYKDGERKGQLNFPKIESGIAYYQAQHKKKRSLAKSLVNLGALWGGVKLLLANQQELLERKTSSLSAAPRQFQKILNAPANLINRGAQPKLDAEQFSILQEAMPAFLLGTGRSQYETTANNPVAQVLVKATKPLVFIFSKIMGAFGLLKLASLGLNMLEKADPQANPNPDFKNSNFFNDLADRGLGFFPLVKSIGDLNRVVNTSKRNPLMVLNGVGGLVTNALLFKNQWNNFLDGLTHKDDNGTYSLPERVLAMLSYLGLDDGSKEKIGASVTKFVDTLGQSKFRDITTPGKRIQALGQAFKGLSFLGDNRGEAVRDQGDFVGRTLQRFMSIILDLPANSLLAMRTLSVFDKLRKHEAIKDEDLENIETGVKLKSSAIMAQKLLVSTVLNGLMKVKIDFGGSLADLKSLEAWKKRFTDWSNGLTNATFLPFAGTIFSPIKKWVIADINHKEKSILRSGIADKIPDIDTRATA
jgi:hypothetical protein